jgi:hypothetical protein
MTTTLSIARAALVALGAALLAPTLAAQKPVRAPGRIAAPRPATPAQPVATTARPAVTTDGATHRASYRVSVTGFTVNKETYDDPLQLDGKRDEVYVSAEVALADKDRKVLEPGGAIVQSKVFGDVNGANIRNGRIRAGHASSQGGLQTGDSYPTETPWRRQGEPLPDALPLAIWQGELTEGSNAVLITPTLWEYDAPDLRDAFQSWMHWNQDATSALLASPELMTLLGTLVGPEAPATLAALAPVQKVEVGFFDALGKMGDRPIGMTVTTDAKTGKSFFTFAPTTIVLNYDTAERLLAQNIGGKGPGVIALSFRETDTKLGGNYTLYLLVERMP